jgi:hypothetical protein
MLLTRSSAEGSWIESAERVMSCAEWAFGPFGLDAAKGGTVDCQRTVLVAVHNLTAATRLADIVPLLESDRRVQVVFTGAPASLTPVMPAEVREFLRRLDAVVVPWQQAVQVRWDLAVAAAYGSLERLHAPVLNVCHGIGYNKYATRWDGPGPQAPREMFGLERSTIVYRGRVIPSAIALPTEQNLERLKQVCPEAAPVALIAGDPCYDRLVASLHRRDAYRQALGVGERKLVAVSSTWGPGSLLQRYPDMLSRLAAELPADKYRVAGIVHPGVWSWHGRRQVRAWFADGMSRGLILVPPEDGWRAVLAAADVIVGDHGSVTTYGAAIGVPALLAVSPAGQVEPGSLVATLGECAPGLRPADPLGPQLEQAMARWLPQTSKTIQAMVTDAPGWSARILREVMYRLMDLDEPTEPPAVPPLPVPEPLRIPATFGGNR